MILNCIFQYFEGLSGRYGNVTDVDAEKGGKPDSSAASDITASVEDDKKTSLLIRKALLEGLTLLPLSQSAAIRSAEIEAKLRERGEFVGTADTMIAGIMLDNGITEILTRNEEHFNLIEGITVINY